MAKNEGQNRKLGKGRDNLKLWLIFSVLMIAVFYYGVSWAKYKIEHPWYWPVSAIYHLDMKQDTTLTGFSPDYNFFTGGEGVKGYEGTILDVGACIYCGAQANGVCVGGKSYWLSISPGEEPMIAHLNCNWCEAKAYYGRMFKAWLN